MTMPLVVSFYTADTPYEQEVERLRRSCKQHGLELHVEAVPSTGTWVGHCALKGPFVLRCLQESGRSILWLDADAEVVRSPEIFREPDFEFAAYRPKHLGIAEDTW